MKRNILYTLAFLFVTLQTFAQTYTYDNLNRLTSVKYGNGVTVNYKYDALGNRATKKVTGTTGATYTINVYVTPLGSGSVTGGSTYSSGATVELNAIPSAGYEFSQWSDGVTDNPRTVTVTRNMSFTAQFMVSTSTPEIAGDIVVDGKVNNLDLHSLLQAYTNDNSVTPTTDIDSDGALSIADITSLVGMVNESRGILKNNGHQYVDLGLPSGTLWATCNVGATTPEESGELYAWGETETKDVYSWGTYKWCNDTVCNPTNQTLTKYCDRGGYGKIDGKISLELEDDVAHVKWGGDWHIPTNEEFQELLDNCSYEKVKLSKTEYMFKFTGPNGNRIFMRACGSKTRERFDSNIFNYWSANLRMKNIAGGNHGTHADYLDYYNDSTINICLSGGSRFRGLSVRPVLSKYKPIVNPISVTPTSYRNHDLVDLGLPSRSLWATTNLGASSPEDYGCYYAWGETTGSCEGKNTYKSATYTVDTSTNYPEADDILRPCDDAATQNWGGEWRMPTLRDMNELVNTMYTTCEWTTENGVNGYRITSIVQGYEGNSIFLPASGIYRNAKLSYVGESLYYWASSVRTASDSTYNSGAIRGSSSSIITVGQLPYYGLTIRPVVSLDAISE